jgi:hypothetical protein
MIHVIKQFDDYFYHIKYEDTKALLNEYNVNAEHFLKEHNLFRMKKIMIPFYEFTYGRVKAFWLIENSGHLAQFISNPIITVDDETHDKLAKSKIKVMEKIFVAERDNFE